MFRRNLPLIVLPIAKLVVHLMTYAGYGMFRDEFYYLACADHLAWGYVDQPPLSILLLWFSNHVFGESLFAVRLLPAAAGALTVLLIGLMARRLGGGLVAQMLAMLAAIAAPVWLASNHFFSMNAFDGLFWALAAYLIVRLLAAPSPRLWIWLGVVLGLGLLNKISVLWLGSGIGAGLVLTERRRLLLSAHPWLAAAIASVIALPHVLWQMQHGWPTVEFIRNATGNKMVEVQLGDFVLGQIMNMNPGTMLLWLGGLGWLLFSRRYRLLGIVYLAVFGLLVLNGTSRSGYLAPAYSWLFAAGGVLVERVTARWRPRLTRGLLAVSIVLSGVVSAPFGLPILPVDKYISYAKTMGIAPSTEERKELGELPQFFADMHGWDAIVETIGRVYQSLPPEEQAVAAVFAPNYGDAGAVDRLGGEYGLPCAISGHNSYWLWGPRGYTGEVVLVLADSRPGGFQSVELGATMDCGLCMPYESSQSVWICRGLLEPLADRWQSVKHFD